MTKPIMVSKEFYDSSLRLAEYVDCNADVTQDFVQGVVNGGDKESYIAWAAAVVGGWTDSLEEMIDAEKLKIAKKFEEGKKLQELRNSLTEDAWRMEVALRFTSKGYHDWVHWKMLEAQIKLPDYVQP